MKWLDAIAQWWARPSAQPGRRDEAMRDEGRRAERQRIHDVYRAASLVKLEPLIEGAMFHSNMSPQDAAVMQVAALVMAARDAAAAAKPSPPAAAAAGACLSLITRH